MKFLRSIWTLIALTWKSLFGLAGVIGVLYLWQDIVGLPQALGLEDLSVPDWLDREFAAYVLLGLVFARLLWIDVRPIVKKWWQKDSRPFVVMDTPHSEGYNLTHESRNTEYFLNKYFIGVGNNLSDGTTLRRVQARLFFFGPPTQCRIRDSELPETDIRDGEWAFFMIGQIATLHLSTIYYGKKEIDERRVRAYEHNLPRGFIKFEVLDVNNEPAFNINYSSETSDPWPLVIVLSADDVIATTIRLNIDMSKTDKPITIESIE